MPMILLDDQGAIPAWATDIIKFLPWSERGQISQLCQAWAKVRGLNVDGYDQLIGWIIQSEEKVEHIDACNPLSPS